MNNILLRGRTTFCLSVYVLMDIWLLLPSGSCEYAARHTMSVWVLLSALGHISRSGICFLMNYLFSIEAAPFYTPTNSAWGFQFFRVLTNTLFLLLVAILTDMRWSLIVIFPWWLVVSSSFSYSYCPFVCLLWRIVYLNPWPNFKLGFSVDFFFCNWVVGVLYIF